METYHKIQTVFKRDPATKYKSLLQGSYSLPEFGYLDENEWEFTEKVDGTNIRVMSSSYSEDSMAYGIAFGGKTDRAQIPAKLVTRLEQRFHNDEARKSLAEKFPDGACLYGEGFGGGIQSGGKYREQQDFVLFDVKIGDFWLRRESVVEIAEALNLEIVPIIGSGTLSDMVEMTRAGFNSIWGDFIAEGIVARPKVELKARNGERIITKIKHNDFRLSQ